MFATVEPGDTVGHLCQRFGLTRRIFFAMNPDKPVIVTDEGVVTSSLSVGESVRVHEAQIMAALADQDQSEVEVTEVDADGRVVRQFSTSVGADITSAGSAILGLGIVAGIYYLIWRGAVSVAKQSMTPA